MTATPAAKTESELENAPAATATAAATAALPVVPASDGRPHVVILGGGFGGLYAARALRSAPVRITLVDRRNHHLFQPLLYQVATASLSPGDIAAPIRSILRRQKNARVILAEASAVDLAGRRVVLDGSDLHYDHLIVATGASHAYFGHPEWEQHAPGLKTIEDALAIRRRILVAFEAAEREPDPARRTAWLTFVIVGAGPTGAELAGALAEISRHALARDFREIDPAHARIVLVEGAPRVLPAYPESLSPKAQRQLERLGVEVRVGAKVTAIDGAGVTIESPGAGEGAPPATLRLSARTVIWAAGVAASSLGKTLGAPLDRAGRVHVEPDLTLPGHPEVAVVGDLAAMQQDGQPVPGVAAAAVQMGQLAARNLVRAIAGQPRLPFRYVDKGTLATLGRAAAVASFGRVKLSGFIAWCAWLMIHILLLIGFRNRIVVLFEWAWSFLTFQRGARLITGGNGPPASGPAASGDTPETRPPA